LDGDVDLEDNKRLDYFIRHPGARSLPYVITFEALPDRTNGLQFSAIDNPTVYTWIINQGSDPLFSGVSGPALDHTKGPIDTTGFYLVSQAGAGENGDVIVAQSPCIDLTGTMRPELKYWYHMFGFEMGNLYLEINDDNGWVRVDALIGQEPRQSSNPRTPWLSRIINLDAYIGKFIRYRFLSTRGGRFSHMAIDDISVYDANAIDVAIVGLANPTSDTASCYAEKNPLEVSIKNSGSDSLNFDTDTLILDAVVRKDTGNGFEVLATLRQVVTANLWKAADGNIYPVPRDSIVVIKFDSTFDMSDTGRFYSFQVTSHITGDFIVDNDILPSQPVYIKSQRKTGQIVSLFPNDSLCKDSFLRVSVRNHFGKLQWEELNIINEANPLAWQLGATDPINRKDYFPRLDTVHLLRSRICVELLFSEGIDETTNDVRVEIFAPWKPSGAAGGRCFAAQVQMNLRFKFRLLYRQLQI
ncbi:MAG: hypothetical protein JKY48_06980, partial [Flavobacteriales bacterium]|nr:hypothetical protein [Flavobacteriales bacterium]